MCLKASETGFKLGKSTQRCSSGLTFSLFPFLPILKCSLFRITMPWIIIGSIPFLVALFYFQVIEIPEGSVYPLLTAYSILNSDGYIIDLTHL